MLYGLIDCTRLVRRSFHTSFAAFKASTTPSRNTRKQRLPTRVKHRQSSKGKRKLPIRFRLNSLSASQVKAEQPKSRMVERFMERQLGDDAETVETASLASSSQYFGSFSSFVPDLLSQRLVDRLKVVFPHLEEPTLCQKLAIPAYLEDHNSALLIAAQTGTGKTLAYALPLVESLLRKQSTCAPRAVVLVPTRELVQQVSGVISKLAAPLGLRVMPLTGALAKRKVKIAFNTRRIDICVATPGMIHWLLSRETTITLRHVEHFVMDEADLCFDKDFEQDVLPIVSAIRRMNARYGVSTKFILVGATFPVSVARKLDSVFGADTLRKAITPRTHKVLANLHHQFVYVSSGQSKQQVLLKILANGSASGEKIVVFCNTRRTCDLLADVLFKKGFENTVTLSRRRRYSFGSGRVFIFQHQSRKHRLEKDGSKLAALAANSAKSAVLLEKFLGSERYTGESPIILVTTDLGSRGLDASHINHVINYDFPMTSMDFLHRVGRTARAGQRGRGTTVVTRAQRKLVESVKEVLKGAK